LGFAGCKLVEVDPALQEEVRLALLVVVDLALPVGVKSSLLVAVDMALLEAS